MKIITIHKSAIDRFCETWPCHGFPPNLDLIVFAVDTNGDLIDLELCDEHDTVIDDRSYDGSGAMLAILDDALANATVTHGFPCVNRRRLSTRQDHIPGTISPLIDYR
jgi:hypothetical protein